MDAILKFLIGSTSIATIIILTAKYALSWIGNAGLEKYKNDLQQANMQYKSSLDRELVEFKIKYSSLHLEQMEIIKQLYSKLIQAEKPLEYLLRPIKVNPSKTDDETVQEIGEKANAFFDFFDENEVIFNDATCQIINQIRDRYLQTWNAYSRFKMLRNAKAEILNQVIQEMNNAYTEIIEGEMQRLKSELRADFRSKLGVLESNSLETK